MKRKTKNKNGFTLVELIVVIAIIAILAGILIPLMTGYLDDSRSAVCSTNRSTIKRLFITENARRLANDKTALTMQQFIDAGYDGML